MDGRSLGGRKEQEQEQGQDKRGEKKSERAKEEEINETWIAIEGLKDAKWQRRK